MEEIDGEWKLTLVDPPPPPPPPPQKKNEHLDLLCAQLASYLESDLHTDVSDAPAHKKTKLLMMKRYCGASCT